MTTEAGGTAPGVPDKSSAEKSSAEKSSADNADVPERVNFIEQIVRDDLAAGKNDGRLHTRFPPEPNGYLHIGHAKAFYLSFSLAGKYDGGLCNLRFDDTNPIKEDVEYVTAIQEDIRWLGCDWGDRLFFASDYFDRLHGFAIELIESGKAYVCDLQAGETREYRGTLTSPGKNSPHRERSVEENLDLFQRMRAGEFPDGARSLRAKIDMSSPNMNMRDPVIYRIMHTEHHRTGNEWCIYPMYDFTHGQSDALEGITHSLCSLEFENHRPLYYWFLDNLDVPGRPQQIEFARLNLGYTVMSKRKLRELVEGDHVSGWDDPRMPTLSGLRRRGFTPASIRNFCDTIGVAKYNSTVDLGLLDSCVRDDLNETAPRVLAVLRPLKVVITNYPEAGSPGDGGIDEVDAVNNPQNPEAGTRKVPFSREIFIDRDDFMEDPPKKYFRLAPGREVRLKYAYYVTCNEVIKDDEGAIVEVRCTYDPESRGGGTADGRKVKGTIQWVSAAHALAVEVRLYDRLFATETPEKVDEGGHFIDHLPPDSLQVLEAAQVEPSLATAVAGDRVQFERLGYFCVDTDSKPGQPIFNRTVTLRDSWSKIMKKHK